MKMTKQEALAFVSQKMQEIGCEAQIEGDSVLAKKRISAYNPAAKKEIEGEGEIRISFKRSAEVNPRGSFARGQKLAEEFKALDLDIEISDYVEPTRSYSEFYGAADEESF